jgi:CDP-glucose 4,6-dehydratase
MEVTSEFWRGKRVFLTGHTGFKGGWLSLWLQSMEAEVHGYALASPTQPAFFDVASIGKQMASSTIADVRDADSLRVAMHNANPEVVLHLAAQPLVRASYAQPAETFATNVMGTVHLLEAVRVTKKVKAVINVTTDKCYENREWVWGYRENEPMGGLDPYSSSKACSELITAAYRKSYFEKSGVALASARAGNVIGGGDWAQDRLIPDFLRAIDAGEALNIRSPQSTRPWQHVLEPLNGYLMLAQELLANGARFAGAWNFGPDERDARPVQWIIEQLREIRKDALWQHNDDMVQPHEAHYLKIDSSKARSQLNWGTRWGLQKALYKTMEWHEAWRQNADMRHISLAQLVEYRSSPLYNDHRSF